MNFPKNKPTEDRDELHRRREVKRLEFNGSLNANDITEEEYQEILAAGTYLVQRRCPACDQPLTQWNKTPSWHLDKTDKRCYVCVEIQAGIDGLAAEIEAWRKEKEIRRQTRHAMALKRGAAVSGDKQFYKERGVAQQGK